MTKPKIAILTSGGDSPGMNAAIRAIVRTGLHLGYDMYGIRQGYYGLIWGNNLYYDKNYNFFEKDGDSYYCIDYERKRFLAKQKNQAVKLYNQESTHFRYNNHFIKKGKFLSLDPQLERELEFTSNAYIHQLFQQSVDGIISEGGTILGSARCNEFKLKFYQKMAERNLQKLGIENVIVIGGDGSIRGALALSKLKTLKGENLKVVAIPGSIDNDIGCTAITIGTYTAVNTITNACNNIASTASAHKRVFVVEVMGRHCGYLAISSFVATGADYVLFAESGTVPQKEIKSLIGKIKHDFSLSRQKKRFLIIRSENYPVTSLELKHKLDRAFKNSALKIGVRVTTLGHVVRGGPATSFDRLIACRLGAASVYLIHQNETCKMVGWIGYGKFKRMKEDPGVGYWDIKHVLNETEKIKQNKTPYVANRNRAYHALGMLLSE